MTNTPHDALFKSVFEQPEHAAAELQNTLPEDVRAAIRWSSLTLEPGSFVDPELADQHSDLLFSAEAEPSGDTVLVYLLFEHQSTNDPVLTLRLLEYQVRIWKRYHQAHPGEPLPVIVPAVLAQVPGGWSAPTHFASLFSPSLGVLAQHVPDFSFAVDDLHRASDEELRARALADLPKVALWLMRDARDADALLSRLAEWAPLLEAIVSAPSGREAMLRLLRYVALVSDDMQLDQFRATLKGLAPSTEALTMTIAEQLRAEGETKGKAEGLAQGKIQGKIESILLVLGGRDLQVSADHRVRIEQCTDVDTLDHWLRRAATVGQVEDLFEG